MERYKKQFDLLLIGSGECDAGLVRDAMVHEKLDAGLHHVADDAGALRFVRNQSPRPDLIVQWLNAHAADGSLKDHLPGGIPVIVIAASAEAAIDACALQANCVIVRPQEDAEAEKMFRRTLRFWLKSACLPKTGT